MTREEFKKTVEDNINIYINNFYRFDSNPQLNINPDTLVVTLENGSDSLTDRADNEEALEAAAASHGMASQEASEYQVTRNADFYAVKPLLEATRDGGTRPKESAVEAIVQNYFG